MQPTDQTEVHHVVIDTKEDAPNLSAATITYHLVSGLVRMVVICFDVVGSVPYRLQFSFTWDEWVQLTVSPCTAIETETELPLGVMCDTSFPEKLHFWGAGFYAYVPIARGIGGHAFPFHACRGCSQEYVRLEGGICATSCAQYRYADCNCVYDSYHRTCDKCKECEIDGEDECDCGGSFGESDYVNFIAEGTHKQKLLDVACSTYPLDI